MSADVLILAERAGVNAAKPDEAFQGVQMMMLGSLKSVSVVFDLPEVVCCVSDTRFYNEGFVSGKER